MTTCNEIVTLALRMANVVPIRAVPTASEGEMGLQVLQGMFDQWVWSGMFGRLTDVDKSASYTPTETGERIRISSGSVTLPDTVSRDGETLPPYDLSLIEVVDTANETRTVNLYDATVGAWVPINALSLTDECPLANRGQNGLASCLAVAWAETFGVELTAGIARNAANFRMALAARHGSQLARTPVEYF